jgi:hypothetical protein
LQFIYSQIWKVKVPKFLAEHITQAHRDGKQIGTMKIQGEDISLHLNDPEATDNIPQNFRVKITKEEVINEYIFTERDNKVSAIQGIVSLPSIRQSRSRGRRNAAH